MGQAILLLHVRSAERISDDIPASSTDDTPPPVCETAKSSAAQMHKAIPFLITRLLFFVSYHTERPFSTNSPTFNILIFGRSAGGTAEILLYNPTVFD